MVTRLPFSAQVDEFVLETEQRMDAVFKESSQRVVQRGQQYISGELVGVITGFMRASVRVSLGGMPPVDPSAYPDKDRKYPPNTVISVVIASAKLGDKIHVGWTAAYAPLVHDGTSKMAGRPWVDLAAMEWPTIVNGVTQELKGRLGA